MLKFAGAVRLSQIVDGVTQVVAVDKNSDLIGIFHIPAPPIVDLQWLAKSMERGEPAPVDDDLNRCQSAEESRETEVKADVKSCSEEGGFEEKLLAQYAAMGIPLHQTTEWWLVQYCVLR